MNIDTGTASRSFQGNRAGAEHFISVVAPADLDLRAQIAFVEESYAVARKSLGLAPETAVFRRLYVSDVLNQAASIRGSGLVRETSSGPVAISIVQQPPLPEAKLAMLAYHVESEDGLAKRRLSPHHLLVEKHGLRHLWSTGLCAGVDEWPTPETTQTRGIFYNLIGALASQGANLRDHCVRTWVYLKDVDVFYPGMVVSRRELFEEHGLTSDTHYIASTGIEGACAHRFDLVAMDAYSIVDLGPQQISYLNDFDRLCATKEYGVTFERGTRIAYADRAHLFISGTASIDRAGKIVHPGDVLRQLGHTLGNVEALLRSGSASLADMMHLTVYLRDPTDFARVDAYLVDRFPDLPVLTVQGAVCRPGWLVEVEGVAIAPSDEPVMPSF